MKLSKACVIGLISGILLCLNIVINFIALMSSEYYVLDGLSIILWVMSFLGWGLMITFFVILLQNSKKIDRLLRDM